MASELEIIIENFGYSELTEEELLLALRLNCITGVKYPSGLEIEKIPFTGATFNVFFISNVLENYMKIRTILDRKFQNKIDGHE